MQQFGRLALLFLLARAGRNTGHALHQRLVRIDGNVRWRKTVRRRDVSNLPIGLVILFDHVCEDKLVSVA